MTPNHPDSVNPLAASTPDALTLASVLCARICHDLAGSLGALSGMLDILAEQPGPEPETLDIARACARELSDRLRLLRAAWGAESEAGDLAALLPGLPGAARLRVDLSRLATADCLATTRLCASLLLLAASALPRGGAIVLAGTPRHLSLRIEGPRAAWPAALSATTLAATTLAATNLATTTQASTAPPGPREVGATMAILQAHALSLRVHVVSPQLLEIS
jgi:histidine phosphotransferase ChpT